MAVGEEGEREPLLSGNTGGPISNSGNIGAQSPQSPGSPSSQVSTTEYFVYSRRWLVLLVVVILNFSNAMLWISFAPIADSTAIFYNLKNESDVNWLSIIFAIVSIPVGLVASWLIDTLGLRAGILLAAWANVIGSVIRVISCVAFMPSNWRFPLVMIGQFMAACAQPFTLFAPTKVAAVWFPDRQRATANMLSSMANPSGVMIASLISPVLVTKPSELITMMWVFTIPAGLGAMLATFGICSSVPPTPPTRSAEESSEPFFAGIKQLFRNPQYLILAVCFGTGMGLFTSLSTLLEQILCPWGYSDEYAGLCGALLIAFGVVGAAIAGVYVDKTRRFEEVAKICFSMGALASIFFALVCHYQNKEIAIAASVCLFGFFGFAIYPICLELGVEASYPVAEASSTGIMMIFGQIQSILLIVILQAAAPKMSVPGGENICGGNMPQDYTYPALGFAVVCALGAMLLTACFKCEYRRLQMEQNLAAEEFLIARRVPPQRSVNLPSVIT